MYKWLAKANPRLGRNYARPSITGFPHPNHSASDYEATSFEKANASVPSALAELPSKKKRGKYKRYDGERRIIRMARYASEHGEHFTKNFGYTISRTTIQRMVELLPTSTGCR